MKIKKLFVLSITALVAVFFAREALSGPLSDVRRDFTAALEVSDGVKMLSIVEANKDKIPAEIKAMLEEAKAAKENKKGLYYAAETMSRYYMDVLGDASYLIEVRKADFESRLTPPVRSTSVKGLHTIEVPKPTANAKNVFAPDNIVIKKGGTVRWINKDSTAHIFASLSFMGKKGIKSQSVEPGKSYDFWFEKPGEYYYICYIHNSMIWKVTVEE
ncbi:MAG: cupredoxin domain-containing protein [Deltaproteobacteria bacterium]|nr:cupredoxin domain-containing protein [Deltaproteobacteria bacterium]